MLSLRGHGMDKKFKVAERKRKQQMEKLYPLIEGGYYGAFDAALEKLYGDDEMSFDSHEIYRLALKKAIRNSDKSAVRFLASKNIGVPILKEVDVDADGNRMVPTTEALDDWDLMELETPFITDNLEIMRILLDHPHYEGSRKVMWTDYINLYYGELTPLAAAVASGNADMVRLLEEKEGSLSGFYGDSTDVWFSKVKTNHITDGKIAEIREDAKFSSARLWSPEEAMLMGSHSDIDMLNPILESERWYGMGDTAIEVDGTLIYEHVHNHRIPSAFYWMDENATMAVESEFPEMRCAYDIQKILESANNVMLATYLTEHENLNSEVVEGMIGQLVNPTIRMMTVEMMDEQASLTDNHVFPFNVDYYDARRKACIETLEAYKVGERNFMILTGYAGEESFKYAEDHTIEDIMMPVSGFFGFDDLENFTDEDSDFDIVKFEDESHGFSLDEDDAVEPDTDDVTIDWGDWDDDPEDDEPGYEKLPDIEEDPWAELRD